MAALALLVRLGASPQFGWNAMMNCRGQTPPEDSPDPRRSFWLELLRDLDSDASSDRSMGLERCLVVLSRSPSPRFLLCVDRDPSQMDFADLLDQLLWADKTDVVTASRGCVSVWENVMETCRLPRGAIAHRVIELGLSFMTGNITRTMISKLFDVLQRLCSSERRVDGIGFRITALRFGTGCSVQPKALETIRDRWGAQWELTTLSLGSIDGIKPASVQECLIGLVSEPASKLRRLGVAANDSYPAFASLFRGPSQSTVEEVDVLYDPSEENAAWLAFAFFHADSQSSVSSLRLRTTKDQSFFGDEWINAFERALRSHTASDDLAATPVKSHPYLGAKLPCKLGRDQEVEKLVQFKNLVGVICPGLGVGWVPVASIIASRSEPSLLDGDHIQTNCCVKALTIDRTGKSETIETTEQHIASMLRLLRLVGNLLESLQLPDCRFNSDHLAQIRRYCPNLKELNISGHRVTRIGPLVDAHATGHCQIDTLSLSNPYFMTNDDNAAEQLTKTLFSRSPLRRLRMHLVSLEGISFVLNRCTTDVATNLALALSSNPQLEFVQLTTLTPLTASVHLTLDPLPLDFFSTSRQHSSRNGL